MLTEPIYRISHNTRAIVLQGSGIFLADPQTARVIDYHCTFFSSGGKVIKKCIKINASSQGVIHSYPNYEMRSDGIDKILSESLIISGTLTMTNQQIAEEKKLTLDFEGLINENIFKNSSLILSNKAIINIKYEISSSIDAEKTLNNRVADLESNNFLQNTIKHYANIALISLILFTIISLSIFVMSCICRSKIISQIGIVNNDKNEMIKHIACLEKYVLSLDRVDFCDNLIKINHKNFTKSSHDSKIDDTAPSPVDNNADTTIKE